MTQPVPMNRWRFWLAAAIAFLVVLWLLNDILLPFVVGMVLAYFFDPVVARLQRHGLSRTLATVAVTILAVLLLVGAGRAGRGSGGKGATIRRPVGLPRAAND